VVNLITSSDATKAIATFVLLVLSMAFTIRITVLFPAIAVDASGATLQSGLQIQAGEAG
jgi:hypothetical protein